MMSYKSKKEWKDVKKIFELFDERFIVKKWKELNPDRDLIENTFFIARDIVRFMKKSQESEIIDLLFEFDNDDNRDNNRFVQGSGSYEINFHGSQFIIESQSSSESQGDF